MVYLDSNWMDKTEVTAPVGAYPGGASFYGLLDMAGNVWAWMADWFDSTDYSGSPDTNPKGPSSASYRVLRSSFDDSVRSANCDWLGPTGSPLHHRFSLLPLTPVPKFWIVEKEEGEIHGVR